MGGLLGWLASIIMGTNDRQGKLLNIVVGIVGAFLGGLLLAPLFGTGTINQGDFSIVSLIVSLLGAVILLAIVGFFRRRRTVNPTETRASLPCPARAGRRAGSHADVERAIRDANRFIESMA